MTKIAYTILILLVCWGSSPSTTRISALVIAGPKDYAVGADHYRSFQFPHQKVVSIDGGHMLYEEENPDFVKLMFAFTASLRP
jgi:proline iminopeptidase